MIRPAALIFLAIFSQNLIALNNGTLPFIIHDSRNKQPVPSAAVCIGADNQCALSDIQGRGTIDSIEPGLYSIKVSASGYDTFTEPNVLVKSGINTTVTLFMNQSIKNLAKITVTGNKPLAKAPSQSTSITRYSAYELSNTPGTANDINRVLSSHPAVVSGGSDFDNTLYVRGGSSSENVFVVDGIEFENTSHFANIGQTGGSIGFINSSLVRDLEFYTGGFPASMPPRISSVANIHLRNGSMNALKTQVDLNMSGLGLVLESPLPNANGSWIANARFVDLRFLKPFITLDGVPRFGDGFLKLTILPSEHSTINATAITSMDTYIEKEDLFDYPVPTTFKETIRQYGGILSWDYNKNNFQNLLSISGTRTDRQYYDDAVTFNGHSAAIDSGFVNMSEYGRTKNFVDSLVLPTDTMLQYRSSYANKRFNGSTDKRWQMSFKDDLTLSLGDMHRIGAGMNAQYRRYNISNENSREFQQLTMTFSDGIDTLFQYNHKGWSSDSILDIASAGGYAEYVMETGRLKVIAGLRGDYFDVITDYGISPRLGARIDGADLGVLSFSAGLYYQFPADFSGLIRTLIANDPNNGFSDNVPLDQARLQRNWQAVMGYERTFGKEHLLSFETYYKWYDREYPFTLPEERQYYTYSFNEETNTTDFVWKLADPEGKKRSYGIELMFQKKEYNNFYYSGALSLFTIENKYTDGKWYHDKMDVSQTLNLSVGTNVFKHHGFALRGQVANGRRYSPVQYNLLERRYDVDSTEGYYSRHLPMNVSVNFRYTFKSFLAWGNITGYIEVMNLLNYTPVVERYFDPYHKDGYRDLECNGILPVAGVMVDF